MEEMKFTSSLSEEGILENFKDMDFFSGIMSGLEEALAYEKGSAKAATFPHCQKPDLFEQPRSFSGG